MNPLVSVIMPAYHANAHIRQAIQSIQNQTCHNWELLVIHEYGSNDGTAEIVSRIAEKDPRIQLIRNQTRLGLAESLNRGIRLARGRYIARMDADDLSHPMRFEKQLQYFSGHPQISLCGTWQHHFGPDREWIHKTAASPEECRASLLFSCDLCHSTVMFRKKDFVDRQLFYDKNYLAEDFELWSRAVCMLQFANIPEVLGEYRWSGENITAQKMGRLAKEHAVIVKQALQRNLGLEIREEQEHLLEGWGNPFYAQRDRKIRRKMYLDLDGLLREIYERNQKVRFYEAQALLNALNAKWRYAKYREPENAQRDAKVGSLEEIFSGKPYPDYRLLWREYRSRSVSVKSDLKRLARYFISGKML